MTATACSCSITGPLLIFGSVFCVYPTFTYIAAQINQHPNQHLHSRNGQRRQQRAPTKSNRQGSGRFVNYGYQESGRNDQHHHSPPRNCYDDQRRFENRNQRHYSPNPPNWQYDERGRSNSPRGQEVSNFRENNWSPIPGERRCRSPSAQGGYNQIRNRSPTPRYHSPSPRYQYDHSPQGQGTSNHRQNCWSPSPAPALGPQFQDRNRSGSLQGPAPSSHSRDINWSPIPGERRYNRLPNSHNQQRRHSRNPQRNYRSGSVAPRPPVFQQPVAQLQNERRTESPNSKEREQEKPEDVKKEPEEREEEEEEPIDEEERRELFAALIREEPKRRIERSNGKWKLSITETCCDPSFLWDKSAELHLYQNIC